MLMVAYIPRRLDLKASIITMFALVFQIGICVFINYQGEPEKAVNVTMSFEIQEDLWKAKPSFLVNPIGNSTEVLTLKML